MAESREYATLVKHSKELEIVLSSDSDILHFLNKEGFITDDVYYEVRDPKSMMSPTEKSCKVVNAISRNKVKLNPQNYHKLLHHFRQDRRSYGDIADMLDNEFIGNESAPQMSTASLHHPVTNSPDNPRPTSKQCFIVGRIRFGKLNYSSYNCYDIDDIVTSFQFLCHGMLCS